MDRNLLEIFNYKRKEPDYALHTFHTYPCKFPAFIPREIIKKYTTKGDIICDPFVGSGTTLLEATLLGYSSVGIDINPLSCLLSKVKGRPLDKNLLNKIDVFLADILENYKKTSVVKKYYYDSIEHWFQKNVIRELSFLKKNILEIKEQDLRDLLLIVLSSIIVKVSNQESDTRYVAINKRLKDYETIKMFIKKGEEIKKIYLDFYEKTNNKKGSVEIFQLDSRDLSVIKDDSVDIIITSPPYANTYDYYLYHKHRKYWLDMDIKFAQLNEIGSRREFSSLKKNPKKWEEDIKSCLLEMRRIVKGGKNIFIIIGDSVINKKIIKMDEIIKKLSGEVNLKYIDGVSSPLSRHSKMFNPSFASPLEKKEHLILLEKQV